MAAPVQIALILLLLLDAIYLFTLLIIRVDWGKDETIPKRECCVFVLQSSCSLYRRCASQRAPAPPPSLPPPW